MAPKTPSPKRLALQQYWNSTGTTGIIARATLRTAQFTAAVIVLGLYASSMHNLRENHPTTPITNEIFALVVSTLSVLTVALHCFLTVKRVPYILWDFVMCVLWAALAGTFGSIYLGGDVLGEDEGRDVPAMKAAIVFDLCGLVLWLLTFLQGSVWCCRARRFTRRTDVPAEEEEREVDVEAGRKEVVESDGASEAETLCDKTVEEEKKVAK